MNGNEQLTDAQRVRNLFIIRLALLSGVLLFAGLTHYMHVKGTLPVPDADSTRLFEQMRYVLWGLCALAVGWAFFQKSRADAAQTMSQVSSALIVGWAPGEGAALLGCVIHFQGGPMSSMLLGILAFVAVLLIARIPRLPT